MALELSGKDKVSVGIQSHKEHQQAALRQVVVQSQPLQACRMQDSKVSVKGELQQDLGVNESSSVRALGALSGRRKKRQRRWGKAVGC